MGCQSINAFHSLVQTCIHLSSSVKAARTLEYDYRNVSQNVFAVSSLWTAMARNLLSVLGYTFSKLQCQLICVIIRLFLNAHVGNGPATQI